MPAFAFLVSGLASVPEAPVVVAALLQAHGLRTSVFGGHGIVQTPVRCAEERGP